MEKIAYNACPNLPQKYKSLYSENIFTVLKSISISTKTCRKNYVTLISYSNKTHTCKTTPPKMYLQNQSVNLQEFTKPFTENKIKYLRNLIWSLKYCVY